MTYQLNLAIPDAMAAEVKSYAAEHGISIAAAVRVLLRRALKDGASALSSEPQGNQDRS